MNPFLKILKINTPPYLLSNKQLHFLMNSFDKNYVGGSCYSYVLPAISTIIDENCCLFYPLTT